MARPARNLVMSNRLTKVFPCDLHVSSQLTTYLSEKRFSRTGLMSKWKYEGGEAQVMADC